jgi:hypothetical protein
MEDFYFYSIVVALVILIGILTMVGITISKGNKTKVYPPVENECPDYWEQGTTGSLIDGNTKGTAVPSDYCKYSLITNRGDSRFQAGMKITADGVEWNDISKNIGGNTVTDGAGLRQFYVQFQNNDASWNKYYPGLSLRCAKRKWANDRGIVWDGVTNYNGCEVAKKT